jgi:hypothetical protein
VPDIRRLTKDSLQRSSVKIIARECNSQFCFKFQSAVCYQQANIKRLVHFSTYLKLFLFTVSENISGLISRQNQFNRRLKYFSGYRPMVSFSKNVFPFLLKNMNYGNQRHIFVCFEWMWNLISHTGITGRAFGYFENKDVRTKIKSEHLHFRKSWSNHIEGFNLWIMKSTTCGRDDFSKKNVLGKPKGKPQFGRPVF